jgi:hypothetical protein
MIIIQLFEYYMNQIDGVVDTNVYLPEMVTLRTEPLHTVMDIITQRGPSPTICSWLPVVETSSMDDLLGTDKGEVNRGDEKGAGGVYAREEDTIEILFNSRKQDQVDQSPMPTLSS